MGRDSRLKETFKAALAFFHIEEIDMGKEMSKDYYSIASRLVKKMSLKEKVRLLYGHGAWHTNGVAKYGLKEVTMHDGPLGLRCVPEGKETLMNGAPKATCFPAPCLTACSWDPSVTNSIGQAEGKEAINQKCDIILAPGCNIKRNPLCGRNFEYLSEDPLLAGKMAAGFINGVQSQGVGCSLKHFACNSQEAYRLTNDSEVDERALREIYLKGFEIAVRESKPWTVMCCYNRVNGVYGSDNDYLLNDTLREEWGFSGIVMSDWGATNDPIRSHNHGLDLEMPCYINRETQLAKAVKDGSLTEANLDAEATRMAVLALKVADRPEQKGAFNYGMGHQVAYEAALNSIVLLKNAEKTLPLKNYDDCCVIGSLADKFRYQGAGSSQVTPVELVNFLTAINVARKPGDEVPFAHGYSLKKKDSEDENLLEEAVALAKKKKRVILFMGLPASYESEGFDRKNMKMPPNQIALFEAIHNVNPNIVVVLLCGAPIELPFEKEAKAIVLAYLPGEAGGAAISQILLGKRNPCGKLAESWPRRYEDVVSHDFYPGGEHMSLYKESIYVGYRYYLTSGIGALYPFGYGLSYTSFRYSNLKIVGSPLKSKANIKVSFKLTNSGKIAGYEIVEVYSSPLSKKVFKPLRELRAFDKIHLKAGESKTISFSIPYLSFAHYDDVDERFEVEGGRYHIDIGSSSSDIKLSGSILVSESDKQMDRQSLLPSYYNVADKKFLFPTDEEFERLLGHSIPVIKKTRANWNSTIGDISGTLVGKIMIRLSSKVAAPLNDDPDAASDQKQMVLETSLRMLQVMGIKEKQIMAIIDLANHNPLKAIYDIICGKRQ